MNTTTTTSRPLHTSLVRRITTATAIAIGATALTVSASSPALAADSVLIDADHVEVAYWKDPASSFKADAYARLSGGTIRVAVSGTLVRSTSTAGCLAARVVFTYAGGSTSRATSPRICGEFSSSLSRPTFSSDTSRQVVRYAVQLLGASDFTAPFTAIGTNTQFIGDPPDSTGTADHLDHDANHVTMPGTLGRTATMFEGSTDYFLQKHEVSSAGFTWWTPRARVTGTLTWSDFITGTEAYLSVHWTYADGSTSSTISAKVVRGSTLTRTVTLSSSSTKPVVAVSMAVYSNQAGYGSVSNGSKGVFGDPVTP